MAGPPPVERLIASLRRLPGIGEKSATRLAFFLLSAPDARVEELADAIARLKKEVVLCEECFDLTGASPCSLCRDPKRDATTVCVVSLSSSSSLSASSSSSHAIAVSAESSVAEPTTIATRNKTCLM